MKILNKIKMKSIALLLVFILLVVLTPIFFTTIKKVFAATNPNLGTAATYSILAGSEVTNTGTTTIGGDVGISPGIGSGPHYINTGTVTLGGTIHDADGDALTAMGDKNTAYDALDSQGCDTTYAGTKDLAGEILVPGVYCADSFHLTGTLTLNGAASDVWIFKSASDLILTGGTAVKVVFTSNGQPCNVWWRVVSTATFDANSTFVGNILADTSITFAAGASLNGRALARTAEVTLSSNSITGPTCATSPSPTPEVSPSPTPSPSPELTPTLTPTVTPTETPTPILSPSPTPEVSPSPTPSPSVSPSPSPSSTDSSSNSGGGSSSSSSSGGGSSSSSSSTGGQVLGLSATSSDNSPVLSFIQLAAAFGLASLGFGLFRKQT